jgi:hypothetical protein
MADGQAEVTAMWKEDEISKATFIGCEERCNGGQLHLTSEDSPQRVDVILLLSKHNTK